MFSGTVRAGEGRSAATVPFWAVDLTGRFWRGGRPVAEMVRLRASSDSIFLRMAWTGKVTLAAVHKHDTLDEKGGGDVEESNDEVAESRPVLAETRPDGCWTQ